MIELIYTVIKDIIALSKMNEAEPIDPGSIDLSALRQAKIISPEERDENFSWAAPRNIFRLTDTRSPTHQIVWITDHFKREKRKIVRLTVDGKIDLILLRRLNAVE